MSTSLIANYVRDERYGYMKIEIKRDQRRTITSHAVSAKFDPWQRALQTLGTTKTQRAKAGK